MGDIFEKELELAQMIYNGLKTPEEIEKFMKGAREVKDKIKGFRNSDERALYAPIQHVLKMYEENEANITSSKVIEKKLEEILRKYGRID